MRRLLNASFALFFVFAFSFSAKASHIVGGEITYTKAATGGYVVSLTMYRDCSSPWNSNFPSVVTMRAYDAATGVKLTNNFTLTSDSVIPVPNNVNANCVTGLPSFCVEKRIYTATWNYTGSAINGIDFEYWLCCRNATISNLNNPNSTGMRYRTTVFPGGVGIVNSTPVFAVDPPTIVAAGKPTTVDFAATDADGDSLYYEFTNALNRWGNSVSYATGYSGTNPLPSTPAASIGSNDGIISANITQQGQFVISVYITEYRNGIPLSRIQRDYQFNTATFSLMDIVLDTTYRPIQCDFTTGVVGVNVDFGQAPYNYSWNTGDTTPVILNAGSGTYTVTVEDAIGCIDSLSIILAEPSELNPGVLGSDPSCFGVNDGAISANIDSLIGPYTYSLNGVQGSGYWNTLDTGLYNVLITDTNGYCIYDTAFQLNSTSNWNPVVIDSIYNPTCWDQQNGGIQLAGSNASLRLTWENGSNALARSNLGAGNYSLFVLDTTSGCYDSLHASITAPDSIILELLDTDNLTCDASNDGGFTIYVQGGTGGKSISINGTAASPYATNGDTLTFASLGSGSFQVDAVDALGCSKSLSLNIGIDSSWNNIALAALQNPTCFGDTNGLITFSGDTTGLSFAWSDGVTTLNRTALGAGSYQLTVANAVGCVDTLGAQLTQNPAMSFASVITSDASCDHVQDASITIALNQAYAGYQTYLNGALQNSDSITPLNPGQYLVSVTDSNGACGIDTSLSLGFNSAWNDFAITNLDSISCFGANNGQITLSGTSTGLSFLWNDGSTDTSRSNLQAGSYQVYLTNAGGCADTLSAALSEPQEIQLAFSTSNATCSSAANGSINFAATGGSGVLSALLDSSALQGNLITGLGSNSYLLSVSDANGCSVDTNIAVGVDSSWNNIALAALQNPTCFGDTNGLITFSGDTTGLSFAWSDGVTTLNRTALGAGSYQLTVANAVGCVDTLGAQLTQSAPLMIGAITTVDASCGSGMDGEISASAMGGAAPYTYTIGAASNSNGNFSGLSSGAYLITVFDSTGVCSVDSVVDVFGSAQGWNNITGAITDPVQCHGTSTGNIVVQTINGAAASSAFYWMDDATAPLSRFGVDAGSYVLVIDNGEGCSDTMSFTVDDVAPISVQTILKEEQCFGDGMGEISLQVSGGMAPYYFNWPGVNTSGKSMLNGVSAGIYYPTIMDDNGCLWADTIELGGPEEITVDLSHTDPYSCGSEDGVIDMMIEGGSYPYYITLNGTQIPNYYDNASAGVQEIVIQDAVGCEWETTIELVPSHNLVVYIPNAFTPTGDGTNENFDVKGDPACFTDTEFIITDRWGNVYFRTEKPFEEFWDGSLPDLPEAQNLAQFQFRFTSNEYVQTGSLTMLK